MPAESDPLVLSEPVLQRVRGLCLDLPEMTVRRDESRSPKRSTAWSFDVRRRSFCLLVAVRAPDGRAVPRLILRVDPEDRGHMAAAGHPYFVPQPGPRHRDRIGIRLGGDPDWAEIGELIVESYKRLAPKKLIARLS